MVLIKSIAKTFRLRWVFLAVAVVAAWEGYVLLKPQPHPLDEHRRDVAVEACWEAVEKLPKLPTAGSVAVLRLAGDTTGYVTDQLRGLIERKGKYTQPRPTLIDRVMRELKIDENEVGLADKARAAGQETKSPFVLFGRVSEFTSDRSEGRIRMELSVLDVGSGRLVGETVRIAVPDDTAGGGLAIAWAVLIWLAFTMLLPFAGWGVIRWVLRKETNLATGTALIGCAMLSWLLGFGLIGFAISSWLTGAGLLLAFVLTLAYDYAIFIAIEARK